MSEHQLNYCDLTEAEGLPSVHANVIPFIEPDPGVTSQASRHTGQDSHKSSNEGSDDP